MAGGWALIGQTAFYLAAFGGYSHRQRRSFVFTVPCAMCVLIWATIVGFIRFALQRQQVTWERTSGLTSPARDRALGPPDSVSNARHRRVDGRRPCLCRRGGTGESDICYGCIG